MSDSTRDMANPIYKPGHNAPPHLFVEDWFYMLTGATYHQLPLIKKDERKKEWIKAFLSASQIYQWVVIAWVVLDNHYHAILRSPNQNAGNLPKFVASYHKFTARKWNAQEKSIGRMVWWNYWDTCIRTEQDFQNRLCYIFWNPVKHGLVEEPAKYPFSNYTDFIAQTGFDVGSISLKVSNVPEF